MTRAEITWDSRLLRRLPVVSTLTDNQFASLQRTIRRRSFAARACILPAGEAPDGLYIIVSGRARLRHQDQDGRALIAETYGPGEFFGEMGLIDPRPYSAAVEAAEMCEVAYVPREPLLECLGQNPAAAMCMLGAALSRLSKAHRQMANLALTNVYGRVAQVLLENGRQLDGEWQVDVGSEQIAAMVGASREMVSRVLKCMIQKRVVRRHKRQLFVLDRATLAAPQSDAVAPSDGKSDTLLG
jgi:CRP/FNR family transcriptional regulator, cyclic AMP receptor protein